MITLRDLLTGAIPGNPLSNIPLGDASDPQFNKFSFNVIGNLGQTPGVNTPGMMPGVFAGPYNVGGNGPAPQKPQQPQGGTGQTLPGYGPRNPFEPIGTNQTGAGTYGNNPFQTIGTPRSGMGTPSNFGGAFGRVQENPYAPGMGSSLMNRMLTWKG